MSTAIIGYGYLGSAISRFCLAEGKHVAILSLSQRDLASQPLIHFMRCDLSRDELPELRGPLDAVIYCIAPYRLDETSYRIAYEENLLKALAWHRKFSKSAPFVLTSCCGIYSHDQSKIASENDPLSLDTPICNILGNGESYVKEWAERHYILRLGSIYGPGRLQTYTRLRGLKGESPPEEAYLDETLNVIHVDDAARLCVFLASSAHPSGIYNGVDCEPTSRRSIQEWLKAHHPDLLSGTEELPYLGDAGGCWVCTNKKVVATGFSFRYPTFRDGLLAKAGV